MTRGLIPVLALLWSAAALAAPSAASEDPMVTAAHINAQLAVAYLKQNDINTAQEKIDKALLQNPRDASVQMSAGLVYERLQQADKADRHFAEALRLEPRNADLINTYAVFQCRHGHYAQGQKLFEQAAKSPSYGTPEVAYANAGVCARGAKNLAQAEELFRKALAARSDYPDALLQLADISFERGAGLAARGFLDRYFTVASPSAEALFLGVRIERSLGDGQAADRYRSQLQKDFPDSAQARQLRSGGSGE
jgi:type IV pilus assembly protein PilF